MPAETTAPHLRVAIRTLGCKVNRTESEALAESLLGSGVVLVEAEAAADLVVVNTCTVTGEADAKARKEVRRALAATAGPVVVAGCLAALDAEGLGSIDGRVVVAADRVALADRVADLLGLAVRPDTRTVPGAEERGAQDGDAFRTRVMVKVQDGCDHRCSYCIVPDARGLPRSVAAADVLARVRSLVRAGTSEVVLTGINIGRYSDPEAGICELGGLVRAIAVTGVRRLRVSSIEPMDLTEGLAAVLAEGSVVPHLHVPLQSGCDRTLAEMGRGYTTSEFAAALARMRAAMPGLAVTTDVIVGFPGETDEDFAASLAFVEDCGFARLHVFRYSKRAGTPAAGRIDQLPAPVIAARAAAMRVLSDRLAAAHRATRVGGSAEVLVERVADGVATGTTEDGLRVRIERADAAPGTVVRVALRGGDDRALLGEVPD